MAVPNHGEGCATSLWPARCPDCGDRVYFFSCSCGSKVFFDLPHPPWCPHEDRCIPYLIRYLKDVQGQPIAAIRGMVEAYARERDVPLPADLARQLLVLENRETGHSTVISVEPNGSSLAALGTVATVNQVSFIKRFARRGTVMGRALMGQLAQEAHVEVELRGERDPATGFIHQFKFFVSLASWQRLKVRVGTSLAADLRDHAMPNGKHVWVAEEVYRMQPARGGGAA